MTQAIHWLDRKQFLREAPPGGFHVEGSHFMFRCPCGLPGCSYITVVEVEIYGRSKQNVMEWNGLVTTPSLNPMIGIHGHWLGSLSGGIWITERLSPQIFISTEGAGHG